MTFAEEMGRVARTQGIAAAVALVERRAAAGAVEALTMLGHWRLWGIYGARDLAQGYAAIAGAAEQGDGAALLTQAALLATGTGVPCDPAAARQATVRAATAGVPLAQDQLALLDAPPPPAGAPVVLRHDPYVARITGLLSAAECDYVIARGTPLVRPSTVIDPASGRPIPNPVRVSDGAAIAPPDEDVVLHAINRRIAAVTSTAWSQGEPLHLLRYCPGQQYRYHLDALPGAINQRVLTVLLYLNDDYEGGETAFEGGFQVKGQRGEALVFANVGSDGRPDARSRHAGLPVRAGIKWLATRWIRAAPHDPWSAP